MRPSVSVKRKSSARRILLGASVAALAVLLTACPPTFPLTITEISAAPDPIVGEVVTLQVEITSTADESDVTILIQLPEGVRLVHGDLTWHGTLRAGEPHRHKVSLCTLYEGDWRIYATTFSQLRPGDTYGDSETIHFIATSDTGHAVPGSEYRIVQGSPMPNFTPSPVPIPASCP